ncbi:conserved virulence factor C family protein [Bacillus sp. CGMCC 1.16607]|uniref:conserved virulence factor C family protein n=1 Tax=Bacillus sp. CGMCC 1.16607 TaxID=3351842 RepID=UPI003631AB46
MKILSIEPTPSPNTMKIILDQELPFGKSHNYKKDQHEGAPEVIKTILKVDGVKGVYHVADFLAVERNAKYDWKEILPKVRTAFGEEYSNSDLSGSPVQHYGEVKALVQMFKGIPLQIKLNDDDNEKRFGLPEMYKTAAFEAQLPGDNYILLRKWQDFGIRYGEMDQVGQELLEELLAAYPEERVKNLVSDAKKENGTITDKRVRSKKNVSVEDLNNPDWRIRFQTLEQMDDPTVEDLLVLEKALNDEKMSIRRLATVYVGMIEDKKVLPLLYKALKDSAVAVRRTAGDCLSDLGFEEAIPEMCESLKDPSKLVRWRAAMYLYEVGDETALHALKEAELDPEFEVSLQVKMAIERIEGGEEAKGSVWKQMTEARKND